MVAVPANHRYAPTAALQRQQAALFLYNLAGRPAFTPPGTASFSDVPVGSARFKQVEWLVSEGIVTVPGNHRFNPAGPLKRNQLAQMLFRLAGEPLFVPPGSATFTDVPTSNAFRIPVEWLADERIVPVPANHRFRPTDAVTRQSVAPILHAFAVQARVDLD